MKLHLNVKTLTGDVVALDLIAAPQDTVQDIKERILLVEPNPFPEQALLHQGRKLHNHMKISDCDIQDGGSLAFEAYATESALAEQLQQLLRVGGSTTIEELGLMYSFKHGVTTGQALQAFGKNELLKTFVEKCGKQFTITEGKVSLPASLPLQEKMQLRETEAEESSELEFVAGGSQEVFAGQLAAILLAQGAMSRTELDNAYCLRHGASATHALHLLGWGEKFKLFLERHPMFSTEQGCITVTPDYVLDSALCRSDRNQAYLALHAKLCDEGFSSQARQALEGLADTFSAETFLNVSRVVMGGAVANGTAIPGAVGAELVLFLDGLPLTGQDAWLSGLAKSVAGGLHERLYGQHGITEIFAEGSSLCVRTDGPLDDVKVFLSPAYGSYSETLSSLRKQGPTAQRDGAPAFVKQRTRFLERQPQGTKAAIRILKWWRAQQQWSSKATRPSDSLLELIVAYVTTGHSPCDLCEAVEEVFSVLSSFESLQASWPLSSRCYQQRDVSSNLLAQCPLLLDPANPLVNVADLTLFQPSELVKHARSGMCPF